MTVSVSGVDLPGDCLWLPHFDIEDFWLETEFEDDDQSDSFLSWTEHSVSKSSGVL